MRKNASHSALLVGAGVLALMVAGVITRMVVSPLRGSLENNAQLLPVANLHVSAPVPSHSRITLNGAASAPTVVDLVSDGAPIIVAGASFTADPLSQFTGKISVEQEGGIFLGNAVSGGTCSSGYFCLNFTKPLTINKSPAIRLSFRAVLPKEMTPGATFAFRLASQNGPAFIAKQVAGNAPLTSNQIIFDRGSNGTPGTSGLITSSQIILSKITNPDINMGLPPGKGSMIFARLKLNVLRGPVQQGATLPKFALSRILFTVNATNVRLRTNSIVLYSLVDPKQIVPCKPVGISTEFVNGNFNLDCTAADDSAIATSTVADTIALGLRGEVDQAPIDSNRPFTLQASLEGFRREDAQQFGVGDGQSHIKWYGNEGSGKQHVFFWVDMPSDPIAFAANGSSTSVPFAQSLLSYFGENTGSWNPQGFLLSQSPVRISSSSSQWGMIHDLFAGGHDVLAIVRLDSPGPGLRAPNWFGATPWRRTYPDSYWYQGDTKDSCPRSLAELRTLAGQLSGDARTAVQTEIVERMRIMDIVGGTGAGLPDIITAKVKENAIAVADIQRQVNAERQSRGLQPVRLSFQAGNEFANSFVSIAVREELLKEHPGDPAYKQFCIDAPRWEDQQVFNAFATKYLPPALAGLHQAGVRVYLGSVATIERVTVRSLLRNLLHQTLAGGRTILQSVDGITVHYPYANTSLGDTETIMSDLVGMAEGKPITVSEEGGTSLFTNGYGQSFIPYVVANIAEYALEHALSPDTLKVFFYGQWLGSPSGESALAKMEQILRSSRVFLGGFYASLEPSKIEARYDMNAFTGDHKAFLFVRYHTRSSPILMDKDANGSAIKPPVITGILLNGMRGQSITAVTTHIFRDSGESIVPAQIQSFDKDGTVRVNLAGLTLQQHDMLLLEITFGIPAPTIK